MNCKIKSCDNKYKAKGYCANHYVHWRKTGNPIKQTQEEKFWKKVNKKELNECWTWLGGTDKDGYGKTTYKPSYKSIRTHRLAWFFHTGKFPTKWILHSCDNPPCCNPNHLFEGTVTDNNQDCIQKGRKHSTKGEHNGQAKQKETDIIKIKELLKIGVPQRVIAVKFGICQQTVSDINCKKIWDWIN